MMEQGQPYDVFLRELLARVESTCLQPYREDLRKTPQTDKWHAEGDVYTHTMMVYKALTSIPEYLALPWRKQAELRIAALLHDIGKPQTTRYYDGDWHSPSHGPVGAEMARRLLKEDYGMDDGEVLQIVRETICLLVRYHDFPHRAVMKKNAAEKLIVIAEEGRTVTDFSIKLLCVLSKADILGRLCKDRDNSLNLIALCESIALREGCYEGPRAG